MHSLMNKAAFTYRPATLTVFPARGLRVLVFGVCEGLTYAASVVYRMYVRMHVAEGG